MPVVATAGWSVPGAVAARFAAGGSALSRYASVFAGVEINSTFYRRHRASTFARWAEAVPVGFRFAVKIPKEITHLRAMKDIRAPFGLFLEDILPLADKRGPLLCQLPPSLVFDARSAERAFDAIRAMDAGPVVIEPRHRSWASPAALTVLQNYSIDRVLADPAPVWPAADFSDPLRYVRLHGKPVMYHSRYGKGEIKAFAERLAPDGWCVFDNTASGAAIENALEMLELN